MPEISAERLEQLERLEATHAAAVAGRFRAEMVAALAAAKCRPDAIEDAVAMLVGDTTAAYDDQGRITKLTRASAEFGSTEELARTFVQQRKYLVAADQTEVVPAKSDTLNPAELIAKAWAEGL